jgi:hypothetical protein
MSTNEYVTPLLDYGGALVCLYNPDSSTGTRQKDMLESSYFFSLKFQMIFIDTSFGFLSYYIRSYKYNRPKLICPYPEPPRNEKWSVIDDQVLGIAWSGTALTSLPFPPTTPLLPLPPQELDP